MRGTDEQRPAPLTEPVSRRDIHQRRGRSWRRWAVLAAVSALVLFVGGMALAAWRLNANIRKVDVTAGIGLDRPTQAPGTGEAVTILLIGSDTRQGAGNDAYGDNDGTVGEAHSDTNLLVHLSADRSSATVVSIPRDSMTLAPPQCSSTAPKEEWVTRQWNQNYRIGGTGCLIRTLEGTTGVFVDHYAVVDFRGFTQMVDALGGVEVCTSEPIDDPQTHLRLAAGRHTLDGRQALQYVRVRKSVGDGSDLGRIERQQAFVSSVMQQATSTGLLLQPGTLYSFLDAATRSLTTDPGLGVGEMRDLASSVRNIGLDRIQFVTVPHEPYAPDPNRVQWTPAADQIWAALREDRPVGEPTKAPAPAAPSPATSPLTVSPADVAVDVVNVSGVQGVARQAREALLVQGFADVTRATAAAPGADGAVVQYSGEDVEPARTVAAAFPGATIRKVAGLGSRVRVELGPGAATVVEVENRLGSDALPPPSVSATPSPTASIPVRTATTDICS